MNFKKLAAALMAAALCVTGAGCSRSAESSGNTGDTGNTDETVSDGGSAREFDTELTAMAAHFRYQDRLEPGQYP